MRWPHDDREAAVAYRLQGHAAEDVDGPNGLHGERDEDERNRNRNDGGVNREHRKEEAREDGDREIDREGKGADDAGNFPVCLADSSVRLAPRKWLMRFARPW